MPLISPTYTISILSDLDSTIVSTVANDLMLHDTIPGNASGNTRNH